MDAMINGHVIVGDERPLAHPYALVHTDCVVGPRTKVWQFASVIRGAKIGADCVIASCAIVDGSTVGNNCRISHGAFCDPGMQIGNDVFIGPHVALCNDYWPRVAREGWFDMDDLVSGKIIVTKIEDGASLGAGAILMPGVTIGCGAMVAAGAVVTQDVPANSLYRRNGKIVEEVSPPGRMRTAGWRASA